MAQPEATQTAAPKSELALIKNEVVDKTASTIDKLTRDGKLHMPANYSPQNALTQAWLILQETVDRDKRPALQVCTKASIYSALVDMCAQGLNPAKKQCYFIVYGTQLQCQRSYFGDMAIAKRVRPGIEFYYSVVYEDDVFVLETKLGKRLVARHEFVPENAQPDKIKYAYCGVVDEDGQDLGVECMTFDQIKKSWGQSKTYKESGGSTPHHSFPDQMCLRTVIRRRCKAIINSSDDGSLLFQAMKRSEEESVIAEVAAEEAEHANGEVIDVTPHVAQEDTEGQATLEEAARPEF